MFHKLKMSTMVRKQTFDNVWNNSGLNVSYSKNDVTTEKARKIYFAIVNRIMEVEHNYIKSYYRKLNNSLKDIINRTKKDEMLKYTEDYIKPINDYNKDIGNAKYFGEIILKQYMEYLKKFRPKIINESKAIEYIKTSMFEEHDSNGKLITTSIQKKSFEFNNPCPGHGFALPPLLAVKT